MAAAPQEMFDLCFRAGKFSSPNDYFTRERGRPGGGKPFERLEWRTGHANQKNRRNTITSSHSCNRTERAGGDKLKCSASFLLERRSLTADRAAKELFFALDLGQSETAAPGRAILSSANYYSGVAGGS
jgi:hypothetical protein